MKVKMCFFIANPLVNFSYVIVLILLSEMNLDETITKSCPCIETRRTSSLILDVNHSSYYVYLNEHVSSEIVMRNLRLKSIKMQTIEFPIPQMFKDTSMLKSKIKV